MAKKMTKREMFNQLKAKYNLTEAEIAFIDHEIELLDRKNTKGEKKLTAQQVVNAGIKEAILDGMETGTKYTVTDLMKNIEACADCTNQRVSALVRQLVNEHKVERIVVKGRAYFKLIEA